MPPAPSATATIITGKPIAIPSRCGSVRRKPKLAPDAATMALLGPGVADIATANDVAARSQPSTTFVEHDKELGSWAAVGIAARNLAEHPALVHGQGAIADD